MKPVIAMVDTHDLNLCVYDVDNDNIIIVDFDKIAKVKHYDLRSKKFSFDQKLAIFRRALNFLELQYGIKNDFSYFLHKPQSEITLEDLQSVIVSEKYIDCSFRKTKNFHHHLMHCYSSYGQSHFDDCFNISWDGVGDDTSFFTCRIKDGISSSQIKWVYDFSRSYNRIGKRLSLLDNTSNWSDIAGKLMGLSSYGKESSDSRRVIDLFKKSSRYRLTESEIEQEPKNLRITRVSPYNDMSSSLASEKIYLPIKLKYIKQALKQERITSEPDQFHFAYCAQKMLEESLIELIREKFYDDIMKCGGNLILTGGVALNVVVNQLVRKTFPEFNVYVSPNSNDSGQSFGIMYRFLLDQKLINLTKRFDISCGGMRLFDEHNIDTLLSFKQIPKVSIDQIANLLRDGNIIGVLQDRHEIGPRALCNRSIICDASFPEMKDVINARIKFREWFRPFAPVCREEDAPKYFDSPNYSGLENMTYIVDIKPQYADSFPSIVHVDGTCRLQTITKEKNELVYELLGKTDGVLLNTSFNKQGQPILNRLEDALDILNETQLDYVVLKHNEEYYLFDKLAL